MKNRIFIFFLPLFFIACQQPNSPSTQRVTRIDTVFTQAYFTQYGHYYQGLDCEVLSLDFYSDGLSLNGDTIEGTGTNLYLSDVFVPANQLEAAEYKVDTTAAVHTALSGMSFEGRVTGAYLLLVNDSQVEKIYLFPTGTFIVWYEDELCNVEFHLVTPDQQTYDAVYRGFPHYITRE